MKQMLILKQRRSLAVVFAIVLVGILLFRLWHPRTSRPPLQIGIWYWKQPFAISAQECARLRTMGVDSLYVRAGTFVRAGEGARLTLPQQWKTTANGLNITLVFNFGYDIVRNFQEMPNAPLADTVRALILQEKTRAQAAGLHICGVQLDFDCPTRRLSKYADLLARLDALRRPSGGMLSVTALPTWFTGGDVESVMRVVDFTVPQFYEPGIGKTLDTLVPISHLAMLESGLQRAGRTGLPFYVGLPAYGHALLYDEKGDLDSLYHALPARDAVHLTSFRTVRAFGADQKGQPANPNTYIGEDLLDLRAVRAATNGKGLGYHLVYDIPTPQLVARHLDLVRRERPPNCRGVILFRYPEADSAMIVPLEGLAAALQHQQARPDLEVHLKVAHTPWARIDTGGREDERTIDLNISVTNRGAANTFLAPDAVFVTVCLETPGIAEITPQGSTELSTYCVPAIQPLLSGAEEICEQNRSSVSRANVVRMRLAHLASGETVRLATLHLPATGGSGVRALWTCRVAGGFETLRGQTPRVALQSSAER